MEWMTERDKRELELREGVTPDVAAAAALCKSERKSGSRGKVGAFGIHWGFWFSSIPLEEEGPLVSMDIAASSNAWDPMHWVSQYARKEGGRLLEMGEGMCL